MTIRGYAASCRVKRDCEEESLKVRIFFKHHQFFTRILPIFNSVLHQIYVSNIIGGQRAFIIIAELVGEVCHHDHYDIFIIITSIAIIMIIIIMQSIRQAELGRLEMDVSELNRRCEDQKKFVFIIIIILMLTLCRKFAINLAKTMEVVSKIETQNIHPSANLIYS